MKIAILLKQVPDTETRIKLNDAKSGIIEDNIKYVVNPYDEYALEEALKLREKVQGETVVISYGRDRVCEAIRTALAMGVDRGIHIKNENPPFLDNFTVAKMLARTCELENFDIIFTGKQAIDDDSSSVSDMVAEILDFPHVTHVSKFNFIDSERTVEVEQELEGGNKSVIKMTLPCVVGCTKGLNEPRYATLPGIMKAKKKEIRLLTEGDLGFTDASALLQLSKVTINSLSLPPERTKGKVIQGEPDVSTKELVRLLREEAKVI